MKIGIITEFSFNSVNFGNYMQTYALNRHLRLAFGAEAETILYKGTDVRQYASIYHVIKGISKGFFRRCKSVFQPADSKRREEMRFSRFEQFAKTHIYINSNITNWVQLEASDYDVFIVGSDIVWFQWPGFIRRIKFLDFKNINNPIKIAYAASFGKNYIPPENIKSIKRCLADFSLVSVREKGAVELLASIGVPAAVHVCDPTLFLSREEWEKIEQKPTLDSIGSDKTIAEAYCFVYLLGNDKAQRDRICDICKREQLQVVTIPYIKGYETDEDGSYGDLGVKNCAPQEWIWLIHHARYVITDSFHGLVFSTIFSTKFITVKRGESLDMNIRLTDYLSCIGEEDKYVDVNRVENLSYFTWNFDKIEERVFTFRANSEEYLRKVIDKDGHRNI